MQALDLSTLEIDLTGPTRLEHPTNMYSVKYYSNERLITYINDVGIFDAKPRC